MLRLVLLGILALGVLLGAQCSTPPVAPPSETGGSAATGGAAAVERCEYVPSGRTRRAAEGRIVGGQPSPDGAYPWVVALETRSGWQYCGASVISDRWLLTAAHCQVVVDDVAHIGTIDLREGGRWVSVGEVRNHPDWRGTTSGNDVAVLRLDADAGVEPVMLASAAPEAVSAVAIGWGAQQSGGSTTPVQRYVTVPLVAHPLCQLVYAGQLDATMLCAGGDGVDSCQGDSGGPLVIRTRDGWEQLGIVSWGRGCAEAPGVYTSVPAEIEWIEKCAR
jgi:secreted trypsin-like serine protease